MYSIFTVSKKLLPILLCAVSLALIFIYGLTVSAQNNATKPSECDIIEYINFYGYMVDPNCEKSEITIPSKFGDVYNGYNELQKRQGFDLSKYRGKTVTQYTYRVLRHPSGSQNVYIHLLVSNNKIIGGDISSTELDGFMEPFKE